MRRRPLSLDLGVSLDFLLETLGTQDALLSRLLPLLIQASKHFWNLCEVIFCAFKVSRGVYAAKCFLDLNADVIEMKVLGCPSVVEFLRPHHNCSKPTPVTRKEEDTYVSYEEEDTCTIVLSQRL